MKTFITYTAIIGSIILSGCSSQRQTASETDDIYYSRQDRNAGVNNEFSTIEPVEGTDFSNNSDAESGYFVKGSSKKANDVNPNAGEEYYAQQRSGDDSAQASQDGNTTINNFYGNTEYYEDGNDDFSYATSIRRFNTTNVIVGYSYYDPFFIDPYWSYGWSYWNPYPRGGWNIGWNSWTGWNVGYSWGYWYPRSSWYYGGGWGYNCWPYCNTWGMAYGGYWGYNNYWNGYYNGYNQGYWNGWNDGNYYNDSPGNSRSIYTGRRGLASEPGFVSTGGRTSPNASMQQKASRTADISGGGMASPSTKSDRLLASAEKLNQTSSVYQVSDRKQMSASAATAKKESRMTATTPAVSATAAKAEKMQSAKPVSDRSKYQASTLSRTTEATNRYHGTVETPGRVTNQTGAAGQGRTPNQSRVTERNATTTNPASNTGRISPNNGRVDNQGTRVNSSVPERATRSNYYRSPERTTAPTQNTRTTNGSPASREQYTPNTNRYQQRPAPATRSSSPNSGYTPSRTVRPSSPSRSVQPSSSPSRTVSPSVPSRSSQPAARPSRGSSMQSPGRGSGSMSSPSPSRSASPAPSPRRR